MLKKARGEKHFIYKEANIRITSASQKLCKQEEREWNI